MKQFLLLLMAVCTLAEFGFAVSNQELAQQTPAAIPGRAQFPFSFEPNRGQADSRVRYISRGREGTTFFTADGAITVAVPKHGSFRLEFEGASRVANFETDNPLPGRTNYLSSGDAASSITNVPTFGGLLEREVYAGIDVRYYGESQHLEHDILLAPGTDISLVKLRLDGVENLRLDRLGNAQFLVGELTLRESAPVAWQTVRGKRLPVRAEWKMLGSNRLGIHLGRYDHKQPVVIDPVLAYSTYLGGSSEYDQTLGTSFPASSAIVAVSVDSSGNTYVAGYTSAIDFPTTSGAYRRTPNYLTSYHSDTTSQSGFVSKFDPNGMLLYSTFLHSWISALAIDAQGEALTAKGGNDSYSGPGAGYDNGIAVDKLSSDGSKLLYSYWYGQTPTNAPPSCTNVPGDSYPMGIQADNAGHVWIAGSTANPCLITSSGAYQTTMKGYNSGFVAELDTTKSGDASIVHSTYLGGSQGDSISGLAVDASGNAYVTGLTNSPDFPHTSVFGTDSAHVAFVSKFNAALSALTFSNWLEGVNTEGHAPVIAIDSAANVYVGGETNSTAFPVTAQAFRGTLVTDTCSYADSTVCTDGFITAFAASGNSMIYSTLLGGKHSDAVGSIAVNNKDIAFVTGFTNSTDFPVSASAFKKYLGSESNTNAFVTAINANGQSLYYSTLLGGSKNTAGNAVTLDPAWNAYVVGATSDKNFPVKGKAYQPTLLGSADGFLSKVVIAGDLKMTLTANTYSVARYGQVTFYAQTSNLGPDGSDNVVLQDPIPAGWSYQGIYTTTATSCTTPTIGATSGTVVCNKTRLESGQSFYVNIYLEAIGASGSNLTNQVSTYAQTQDLKQGNNQVKVTVHVQ